MSVALCTYNGGRFLPDQLASIREQTRLPDELVVCDDASTDDTAALVREYADRVPFRVKVVVNPATLGSTRNFAQAIGLCTGDVIALADQDDEWLPPKLATLEAALQANPAAGFVFGDAEVVDEQLNPLGYRLWQAIRFGRGEQQEFRAGKAFEGLLRRYRVTGATMAFRSSFRDLVLPIPPEWVHDAWVALLISAVAPCVLVAEPLVRYRQHAGQQHGGTKRGLHAQYAAAKRLTREACAAVAARYAEALERLRPVPGVAAERLSLLGGKVEHHRRRAAMRDPGVWRLPRIVCEVWRGNYRRYSLGWKAAAQDWLLG
jgi:glycosyltransferase involved in cell wall biosynthesis